MVMYVRAFFSGGASGSFAVEHRDPATQGCGSSTTFASEYGGTECWFSGPPSLVVGGVRAKREYVDEALDLYVWDGMLDCFDVSALLMLI